MNVVMAQSLKWRDVPEELSGPALTVAGELIAFDKMHQAISALRGNAGLTGPLNSVRNEIAQRLVATAKIDLKMPVNPNEDPMLTFLAKVRDYAFGLLRTEPDRLVAEAKRFGVDGNGDDLAEKFSAAFGKKVVEAAKSYLLTARRT